MFYNYTDTIKNSMKNLPNIDIIIPNYNKADYLKECLTQF